MSFDDLKVRQLDKALEGLAALRGRRTPESGWIRTIREALGMSLRQLAERTKLTKNAIASAEANEARGTAQLNTLRTLADAMECDVVYAIVPRRSLAATIDRQAEVVASTLVDQVADSMELEAQGVGAEERDHQVRELKARIIRDRGSDFWDAG